MIAWQERGGPVPYRSKDWLYSVGEVYTAEGIRYRACFHAKAEDVRPIGPLHISAGEAKHDAENHWARIQGAA